MFALAREMPQSLYHLAQPTIPGYGLGSAKSSAASGAQTVKCFPGTGRIPDSRVPSEAGERPRNSKSSRNSKLRERASTSDFERDMVSRLVAATEAGGAETTSVARALLAECLLEPVCAPTPVPKPIVDFWATNTFEPEVMAALDISKPRLSASGRVNRFVSHCGALCFF